MTRPAKTSRDFGERPALRKRLGQHHLRQGGTCRPALEYLSLSGQRVIEIGPGGGVLTRELRKHSGTIIALELDRDWAFHLATQMPDPGVRVVVADALDLDWRRVPLSTRVVGNLPYSISTVLIEKMLDQAPEGLVAAFLIQLEVAERLCAVPGSRSYGSLSVLVAERAEARILGRVPSGAFVPPPRVMSAFVGLTFGRRPEPEWWSAFKRTVRQGFQTRRKMLGNALAGCWGRSTALPVLARAGIEPRRRAESVTSQEWRDLHRALEVERSMADRAGR